MELKAPLTARYASYAPVFPDQHHTNAQKAGLKYERNVMRRLGALHTTEVGPWLLYSSAGRSSVCQPDGLVWLSEKLLCIVEIKLSWQREVRRKLMKFYGPLVQCIHPGVELTYLQVYKTYRKGCHKKTVSLYELETLKAGAYKECQAIL